ncbi:MAG: exodeoxyribonuclease VII large subunit [Simkaniaceae bacterium]|nr:exodeoxyribonuclease VII large subunit [Simkaniaceae bacterium]
MSNPLTVSELTLSIKNLLEPAFLQCEVRGEVTNLRHQASGHLYFTLKDEFSQISAVLFKGIAEKISPLPKNGDEIILKGSLSLYAPRGSYQIIGRSLAHAGVGDLLLKFHEMKNRLAASGVFDAKWKKQLPPFPKKIGVVTSPTGSVIQDILNVLTRRHDGFHLILNPVRVQGKGSELEIARAIDQMNEHNLCDVLIVGRGGGSLEDLWPFNEECVAKAIFNSKIPIISAVGHETDVTIADYVADLRAPTPSAAAEIVVREKKDLTATLADATSRLDYILKQKVKQHKLKLGQITGHPLFTYPDTLLAPFTQRLDEMSRTLATVNPSNIIAMQKEKLKSIATHLAAIDPRNVLKKGYCIPFAENSTSVILNSKQITSGQNLELLFHDGKIKVKHDNDI